MKKIKMIILLVLLSLPMVVNADMAAPMSSYNVRVSNVNGTDIYKYNQNTQKYEKTGEKANYDEIYFVNYENIINNELYGFSKKVDLENDPKGENSELVYIKLSDTMPLEIELEDLKKETKLKYYVFDNTNYLYKGPSTIYGKVEPEIALEIGITIEVEYYDDMWAYVEYKGVKGWVYTYTFANKYGNLIENSGMVRIYDNKSTDIFALKDLELYSSPKEDKKLGKIIPKNTKLEQLYSYTLIGNEGFINNYYVEYNGVKGWIRTEYGRTIFNKKENTEKAIINIGYNYFSDNNMSGIKNQDGVKLYSDYNDENSVIATIPYEGKINILYEISMPHGTAAYRVKYNELEGWIRAEGAGQFFHYDENGNLKEENVTNPNQNIIGNVIEGDMEEDNDEVLEKETSINEKIIYYICGTVVVCLTAFVTILLVNKKRKLKNAVK